jgi:hypothetical protein
VNDVISTSNSSFLLLQFAVIQQLRPWQSNSTLLPIIGSSLKNPILIVPYQSNLLNFTTVKFASEAATSV